MQIIQLGMNTADMAGSLRLFSEVLGFANAGAQALWGAPIRVQGLDEHDRALMWWMVGRQPRFQLEFFHHTRPLQRPLRADWRPNDLGWVRVGAAVTDFDIAFRGLAANGLTPLAQPSTVNGLRRVSFREPYIGSVIEIMEDGPALPWRPSTADKGPFVVYAATSVADLDAALRHYRDTLDMVIEPLEELHNPENEAAWGLGGARRRGFLAHRNDVRIEVVEYLEPRGRPRPGDYRTSDQGIVNFALGSRSTAEVEQVLGRLRDAGHVPPHTIRAEGIVAGYITDSGYEVEVAALPSELDSYLGFIPSSPFMANL
jgi:catechol 2,3-dioxygenase-like lactoylglutathione lyase family enzyme